MTGSTESYSPDEVVARGKALYEKDIRAQVETGNVGRLLLVDLTTGNWVMGEDRIEMARQLRARNPQAQNYGMRVGYPTTTAIGTSLRPLNEANPPHWRVREKLDDLWRVPAFRPPAGAVFRCLFPCDIFGIMRWSKNHAHQGGKQNDKRYTA